MRRRIPRLLLLLLAGFHLAASAPTRGNTRADLSIHLFYPIAVSEYRVDNSIDIGRTALVSGMLLGSMTAIHFYQQNGWWKDNRRSFHFQEDLVYGVNVDKIGHFYGGYLLGWAIARSYAWTGIPEPTAQWIGAGGSLLFQTYIEVQDGYSTWGFDRVDFAADVVGASWLLARYYVAALRSVDLKLSYHPSDLLGNPGGIGFRGQKHLIIDDYEGQTFWLSVKVDNVLPRAARPYWPDFLCVALGYGARDVANPHPYRVYFIGLDLDMTRIVPPTTPFLKTVGEALNFVRLPLPALRIKPGMVWYGVYF